MRRELPGLQTALHSETVAARQYARHVGRERLGVELGKPLPSANDTWTADDVGALAASGSLAAAWGSTALAVLAQAETPEALARALVRLPTVLESRVARTAATETAFAFNDERDAALSEFAESLRLGQTDHNGDNGRPAPGMFKVWSAVLDGRTCSRCFALDGLTIEMQKPMPDGPPPLHPWCRCVVEHVIIAKTERIEDIGIDYGLFKDELRDVIREHRIISQRHAVGFLSDSLGTKRSPEVLARRFREEKYATNAQPTVGFRRTPKPIPKH